MANNNRASAHGQFLFVNKAGTYNVLLTCNVGDLFQRFDKLGAGAVMSPDFTSLQPVYTMRIYSSRSGENGTNGYMSINVIKWYVRIGGEDVEIIFNTDGTAKDYSAIVEKGDVSIPAGTFKKGEDYTLKILDNLAQHLKGKSTLITCRATVSVGGAEEQLTATAPISITQGTTSTKDVFIKSTDGKNFTVQDQDDSCTLGLEFINFTAEDVQSYVWEKFGLDEETGKSKWLTIGTADTLTMTAGDIDTTALVRITVTLKNNAGVVTDQQTVNDVSDPYDVLVEFSKGATENDKHSVAAPNLSSDDPDGYAIFFYPKLVKQGETTPVAVKKPNGEPGGPEWSYLFTDSAGIPLKWYDHEGAPDDHEHVTTGPNQCVPETRQNWISKEEASFAEVVNWYITGAFTI